MNTLHITAGVNTEVAVPVFAWASGSLFDPSVWTAELAVRPIYDTSALVYQAATWELDDLRVQNAKRTYNLAAGRYDLWCRVTTPQGIKEQLIGVVIVVVP